MNLQEGCRGKLSHEQIRKRSFPFWQHQRRRLDPRGRHQQFGHDLGEYQRLSRQRQIGKKNISKQFQLLLRYWWKNEFTPTW
jgi:hypothetical protein